MLQPLDTDIWIHDIPFTLLGCELGARMTVVRLRDGALWVHSPLAHDDEMMREMAGLGPVRHLVSPNKFHHGHLLEWSQAYPEAQVYAAPGLKEPLLLNKIRPLGDEPEPAWAGEMDQALFRGSVLATEAVFCHRASGTLILTDTSFNIPSRRGAFTRIIARFLGILDNFGPSRSYKLALRDRSAARASLNRILKWDFDRILIAHGDYLPAGGKETLRRVYSFVLVSR